MGVDGGLDVMMVDPELRGQWSKYRWELARCGTGPPPRHRRPPTLTPLLLALLFGHSVRGGQAGLLLTGTAVRTMHSSTDDA